MVQPLQTRFINSGRLNGNCHTEVLNDVISCHFSGSVPSGALVCMHTRRRKVEFLEVVKHAYLLDDQLGVASHLNVHNPSIIGSLEW